MVVLVVPDRHRATLAPTTEVRIKPATVRFGPRTPVQRGLCRDNATVVPITLERSGSEPMDLLEPLDVAMMAAEPLSDPMHVAALLILSPPAEAGPGYVDELYRDALTSTAELDPIP